MTCWKARGMATIQQIFVRGPTGQIKMYGSLLSRLVIYNLVQNRFQLQRCKSVSVFAIVAVAVPIVIWMTTRAAYATRNPLIDKHLHRAAEVIFRLGKFCTRRCNMDTTAAELPRNMPQTRTPPLKGVALIAPGA